jgi:alpha-glucosidase
LHRQYFPIYSDFGYDISDYEAIQPEYGTMQDFDELIARAKELGKLIVGSFQGL